MKNEGTSNTAQMPDEKSVIQHSNNSHQSNYPFCNDQVARVSSSSKHKHRHVSKPKINTHTSKDNSTISNSSQLVRVNVLKCPAAILTDEILDGNQNVGNIHTSQKPVSFGPYISPNQYLEIILEKDLNTIPVEPEQDQYQQNHETMPPVWEAGCSTMSSNMHPDEKNQPQNIMINPNRATYLGSDGWRSMPNEINQPSGNILGELQLARLQQEHRPSPSTYTNLTSPVLDSVNQSTNAYFYTVLDEELKTLPGGPKRWRYLIRDLIRADPNVLKPAQWRFLLNQIKRANTNTMRTRNTPTYLDNHADRLIYIATTQLPNYEENPPIYP